MLFIQNDTWPSCKFLGELLYRGWNKLLDWYFSSDHLLSDGIPVFKDENQRTHLPFVGIIYKSTISMEHSSLDKFW